MTPEEIKKIKIDLLWKVIEHFQSERIKAVVLSYNDVELFLYQMLEEIDPGSTNLY